MFFPDESPFLDNQLIVSFFLFLLFLLFLFGVAYKFTFLDGDNLKLFFTDFLFGEEPRRIDLWHVLRILQVEQSVVLLHLLMPFERSKFEIAKKFVLFTVRDLSVLFFEYRVSSSW